MKKTTPVIDLKSIKLKQLNKSIKLQWMNYFNSCRELYIDEILIIFTKKMRPDIQKRQSYFSDLCWPLNQFFCETMLGPFNDFYFCKGFDYTIIHRTFLCRFYTFYNLKKIWKQGWLWQQKGILIMTSSTKSFDIFLPNNILILCSS